MAVTDGGSSQGSELNSEFLLWSLGLAELPHPCPKDKGRLRSEVGHGAKGDRAQPQREQSETHRSGSQTHPVPSLNCCGMCPQVREESPLFGPTTFGADSNK